MKLFVRLLGKRRKTQQKFGPYWIEVRNYPFDKAETPIAALAEPVGTKKQTHILVVPPTDKQVIVTWLTASDGYLVDEDGKFVGVAVDTDPYRMRSGSIRLEPCEHSRSFRLTPVPKGD